MCTYVYICVHAHACVYIACAHRCACVYACICGLMSIWEVSIFWPLPRKLLWMVVNRSFHEHMFPFFSGKYLGVKLPDCMLKLLRNCQILFQSSCAIVHSHQQHMRTPFLSSSPTLGMVSFLNFSHSNKCVVVYYWGFNLHLPED